MIPARRGMCDRARAAERPMRAGFAPAGINRNGEGPRLLRGARVKYFTRGGRG
jgi:hypothetical protein